jgi:lipopolysaccharide heptosyltransferase III
MRRLLIRPGAIGDVILSLPALEAARAEYTEVWAPRVTLPLIRFADKTRAIADTGLDLVGITDAQCPALESFDEIYSWYGTARPEFREAVAHLPFTFFPAQSLPDTPPRIVVPPVRREPFTIIHPYSSSEKKNWPLENFQAVAAQLKDVEWCVPGRIEDLYELAYWISTASLYIGNDSGISHLAAAVGTPVIAIFVSTDPRVWAPRGERVVVLDNPSVDQVLRACAQHQVLKDGGV